MLDDSLIQGLYMDFDKFVSKKDGHVVHAILWNGTKKMFKSTDLHLLDYADLNDKGASHMAGENPTKDGEYCLSFYNSSIDDDCEEFDWMPFSVEQFAEANQAYIVIGTGAFDEKDPLVFPRKRFEKEFKPIADSHDYITYQQAICIADDGYPVSEISLNGIIFKTHHLFFTDRSGRKHDVAPHLVMVDNNYHYTHIISEFDLPIDSQKWYVVR